MSRYLDYENLSNYQLGKYLLADWIKEQSAGIVLTHEFAEKLVAKAQTVEAKLIRHAGMERALRKAAKGNFEGAGADMRQLLTDGVEAELKARRLSAKLSTLAIEREITNEQLETVAPIAEKAAKRAAKEEKNRAKAVVKLKEKGEPTKARVLKEGELIMAVRSNEISGRELGKKIHANIKKSLGTNATNEAAKGFSLDNVQDLVKTLRREGKLLKP